MKLITPAPVEGFTRNIYRWFRDTHLRSLDRALQQIPIKPATSLIS